MTRRTALITGITGQDGSYLAELLLDKGYEVHGLIRRSSQFNTRADRPPLPGPARARDAGCSSTTATSPTARRSSPPATAIQPDEVYNLGAQSHVKVSFDMPEYTAETVAMGTLRLLEAIRGAGLADPLLPGRQLARCSARSLETPQRETTPFHPRSPYAVAKVFAY